MEVIQYNKITGKYITEEYPRIDTKPVINLAEELEYFEIVKEVEPSYNINEYTIHINTILTEQKSSKFPALKVAIIEYELQLIPKNEVISNFNNAFGTFIDSAYPIWQRVKDLTASTNEGTIRQAQEASLRETRQERELLYINDNIFPDFNFYWL